MLTLVLCTEGFLNGTLRLVDREPINRDSACLRERNLTLAVNDPTEPIRVTTPQIHYNIVPRPKYIIGTHRKIHREFIRIPRANKKGVASKSA